MKALPTIPPDHDADRASGMPANQTRFPGISAVLCLLKIVFTLLRETHRQPFITRMRKNGFTSLSQYFRDLLTGRLFSCPQICVSQFSSLTTQITDPTLLTRAAQLDQALRLQPGHGIAQVMLAALIGDIQAGDYDRILCTWSFTRGEKWATRVLDQVRQCWAAEDANNQQPGASMTQHRPRSA